MGLTGVTGCLGGGGGGASDLNLAFTVPVENLGSLFAIEEIRNELTNVGDKYELSVSRNSSTPDSLNAMAAGELDLALLSTVSYGSAVSEEAVPGNISMVSTDFWDAHPDWYGFTLYAHPDTGIENPEDMEGATVAVNAKGTGVHAIVNKAVESAGLDPENDIELTELDFPAFTSALKDGRIDVGIYPAIFAVGARAEGFTPVVKSQDLWDEPYPFAYTVASNDSLDSKSDAIELWGEDLAELVNYAYDNRSEVVSLAANQFDLPESLVDGFFLTNNDYYRQDIQIDMDRLQSTMDELVDMGFLEKSFDVTEYATNDYVPSIN
ncbi:MAG: ABC transporter substrate-binding protein [Halobacterium sp.]